MLLNELKGLEVVEEHSFREAKLRKDVATAELENTTLLEEVC